MRRKRIWPLLAAGLLAAVLLAGCGGGKNETEPADGAAGTETKAEEKVPEKRPEADTEAKETAETEETAEETEGIAVNEAVASMVKPTLLAADGDHVAAVTQDGRVLSLPAGSAGTQTENWTDIVSVAAGPQYTIGLKSTGILVADGKGQVCEVEDYSDAIAIFASGDRLARLRADGSMEGTSGVSEWKDVISVVFSANTVCGLRTDGTVVVVNPEQASCKFSQEDVEGWSDIVSLCLPNFLYGLKADGTVVAMKQEDAEAVSGWTGITALFPGMNSGVIGLRADGTLLCSDEADAAATAGWTDIVAIARCNAGLFAVRSDGTAVTTSEDPAYDVSGWTGLATGTSGGQEAPAAGDGQKADGAGNETKSAGGNDASIKNGQPDPAARYYGQENLIALENFESGVVIDEEKCRFEIVSAEETDEAYVFHYLLDVDPEGYRSFCMMRNITVNGYPCSDVRFYEYESGDGYDGDNVVIATDPLRPARMEIPKASLDPGHADGIHSLWISFQAGHTSDYATTSHTTHDIALYPGVRDDDAWPQVSR